MNGLSKNNESGFTLIELAIIMLIAGILTVPLVQLYSNYISQERIETTKTRIIDAAGAIARASSIRYPCPSDRSLAPTDPNYGLDVCSITGFTLAGVPMCDTTGAEQGICKVPGTRDIDGDTIAGNNNEFVLIGGIPLKVDTTVIGGISAATVQDSWGKQLSYAVSYTSATSLDGFTRFKNGLIRVVDEFGNDTAGTNNDAQFIVFSHGPDRNGGFEAMSGIRQDCVIGNIDGENCDGDNVFTLSLAHQEGTLHYDDYAYVQTDESANLWLVVPDGTGANLPTTHIKTIPNGIVGINTDTPGSNIPVAVPAGVDIRLDVDGDIRADTVRTQKLCTKDGASCIDLDPSTGFFGTQKPANDCPNGEVISSIGNNQVFCSKAAVQVPGTAVLCPVTTWIEQILTDGKIKCTGGVICPGGAGCL